MFHRIDSNQYLLLPENSSQPVNTITEFNPRGINAFTEIRYGLVYKNKYDDERILIFANKIS